MVVAKQYPALSSSVPRRFDLRVMHDFLLVDAVFEDGLTLVVEYKYYSDILYERFDDMYVYEYFWGLYEIISADTIAFHVKLHAVDSREE